MEDIDVEYLEKYIKLLEYDNRILIDALLMVGKYARINLPVGLLYNDENFQDYVSIIVKGFNKDPEGKEFVNLWLDMAEQKIFFDFL